MLLLRLLYINLPALIRAAMQNGSEHIRIKKIGIKELPAILQASYSMCKKIQNYKPYLSFLNMLLRFVFTGMLILRQK